MRDAIETGLAAYCLEIFEGEEEGGGYDIGARFERLLAFVREHRSFYRIYYASGREERLFRMVLPETLETSLNRLSAALRTVSVNELSYRLEFFRHGFAAMVRSWLMEDCPESPEEMVRILAGQFGGFTPPEAAEAVRTA